MLKKPCTGELVFVDGKYWCIGEKIISKWKYSKFKNQKNQKKSKKNKKNNKRKTARK